MSDLSLVNGLPWREGEPREVHIAGGLIDEVGPGRSVDCAGLTIAPGFIDLQINGGFGADFTFDPGSIWTVGARLPESGVSAFLPTLVSPEPQTVLRAQEVLRAGPPRGYKGALPLGLHCEGPMIASERRGTHPEAAVVAPSLDVLASWEGTDQVRMVTLAPELSGAKEVVEHLVEADVLVAAGHSNATYEEAVTAFGWGVAHGTHLFNAMSGTDHRHPGLAAALLGQRDVSVGLIADGIHSHPGLVSVAFRSKGAGIALVTDAVAALGMESGVYPLGDQLVILDDGQVRNSGSILAGSTLTMDQAVRNFMAFTGCSTAEAIASATETPAGILGDRCRGSLRRGCRGDVVLLDEAHQVVMTVVGGEVLLRAGLPS